MTAITPPHHAIVAPNQPPPPSPPLPPPGPVGETRRGIRVRRAFLVLTAAILIAVGLLIDGEAAYAVPVLFVLVVPFEKLFPRHRQKLRRPQVGTDIGYALAGPLLQAVGVIAGAIVAIVSLAWVPGLLLRPVVGAMPAAFVPFVGIALFDLAIYWTHRWYHEVPFLWRFHAIHHSPEHMDWISGFRNHPFDGTLIAPAFIFLIAAGFEPEFTGALAVIQIVLGIFLHANVRWRLRWLHKIVITPEFHHWHHANEPGAINSNYSVFLPAWDLIFGTYFMPKERRPQVYGVTEYIPTGMAAQLWHPMRGMGNPLRIVVHPIRGIKGLWRFTRQLLRDMKRSATRPRRRSHDDVAAWPTSASGAAPRSEVLAAQAVAPAPAPPTRKAQPPIPPARYRRPASLAEVMNWDRPPFRR